MTSSPAPRDLTPEDLRFLHERGMTAGDARRQLELLRNPPAPALLVRPAVPGDGVVRLPEGRFAELTRRFDEAARRGRFTKMVPASGAATRMFQELLPFAEPGADLERRRLAARAKTEPSAAAVLRFADRVEDLALWQRVPEPDRRRLLASREQGDLGPLLRHLLGAESLGLASLPKGLLPFHRHPGGIRTPLEEHLLEAAGSIRDAEGRCRLHLTVSPSAEEAFRRALEAALPPLEAELGVHFEVSLSTQSPATDTLALAEDGSPFREPDGRLLLRPGGHGALLGNLDALGACGADLVLIKNVDNVLPTGGGETVGRWKRLLGGYLVELEEEAFALRADLEAAADDAAAVERALDFLIGRLHLDPAAIPPASERSAFAAARLDRPLRVCGVVPNRGEPGGGPFWVRGPGGEPALQIVEGAQIGTDSAEQREILSRSTHFNPVDLACGLRSWRGEAFALARFTDPEAVFDTAKTHGGETLRALERPGLWNGAMARWNTVFVEVPAETFAPVKTVFDLLRPEHLGEL